MVEIETGTEEGVSITDTGILDKIEEEIVSWFDYCKRTAKTEIGISGIYIVGSYARGEATKGESDLDIVISYEHIGGEELDPHFDVDKVRVSSCISDHIEDNFSGVFDVWFDGVDVLATTIVNEDIKLSYYFDDTRVHEIEGEPRVYDLINREYIYEGEL